MPFCAPCALRLILVVVASIGVGCQKSPDALPVGPANDLFQVRYGADATQQATVTAFRVVVVTSTKSKSGSKGQLHWIPPDGHLDLGWRLFPKGQLNSGEACLVEDRISSDLGMTPSDFSALNTRLCLGSDDMWRPASVHVYVQTTDSDGGWIETVAIESWDSKQVFSADRSDKPRGGDAWCERDLLGHRIMPVHCECD